MYTHYNYKMFQVTIDLIDDILSQRKDPIPSDLPDEFRSWIDIFSLQNTDKLLLHRSYDYDIRLKEKAKLPFGVLYFISRNKLTALKD
ncbi:hypothetical protein OCU04_007506 [Sclerotinia nivalis]|uniref:Uncharacterized protein n=1 Tax=Sclerotinia nivalis TaxID=352851 RepID=A0A9X0AJY0_9HELO|nr:hypothetical protein OCU04_007506 [Sclerotinia nivalis]